MGDSENKNENTPEVTGEPTEPSTENTNASMRERLEDIKERAIAVKNNFVSGSGSDDSSETIIPESIKIQMDKIKDKVMGIKAEDVPYMSEAKDTFGKVKLQVKEGYNGSLQFVSDQTLILDEKMDQLKGKYVEPVAQKVKVVDRVIRKHPETLALASGVTFAIASRRRGIVRMMRNGVWGTVLGVGALYYVSMS